MFDKGLPEVCVSYECEPLLHVYLALQENVGFKGLLLQCWTPPWERPATGKTTSVSLQALLVDAGAGEAVCSLGSGRGGQAKVATVNKHRGLPNARALAAYEAIGLHRLSGMGCGSGGLPTWTKQCTSKQDGECTTL